MYLLKQRRGGKPPTKITEVHGNPPRVGELVRVAVVNPPPKESNYCYDEYVVRSVHHVVSACTEVQCVVLADRVPDSEKVLI